MKNHLLLFLSLTALIFAPFAYADRANGKTSEAVTSFLYEEPLTDAEKVVLKRILDFPSLNLSSDGILAVVPWGDSLTQGTGTNIPWPAALDSLLGGQRAISNQGIGGESSTLIKNRVVASTALKPATAVFWMGYNDIAAVGATAGDAATIQATVIANYAASVAALGHNRFLIVGLINGSDTDQSNGLWRSNLRKSINAALLATYGASKFLDIHTYLVSQYNPSVPQDVTDYAADIVPGSLRVDGIHLTTAAHSLVAAQIYAKLIALDQGEILSASQLAAAMSAPPSYGTRIPGSSVSAQRVLLGAGSASAPALSWIGDTDTGWRQAGAGDFRWTSDGVDILRYLGNNIILTDSAAFGYGSIGTGGPDTWLPRRRGAQFLGFGQNTATPLPYTLVGNESANGTNIAGAKLQLGGGRGTGSAAGGAVTLAASLPGAGGSTNRPLVDGFQVDANTAAGETMVQIYDITAGAMCRVSIGAADSAGTGFRPLRIPN